MLNTFTLCVPYYRQPNMLREQLQVWEHYPTQIPITLVDDGSPEPAKDVVLEHASPGLRRRMTLYRIGVDIPWNRGGARNLAAHWATTEWLVHIDIDHVLPLACAARLLAFEPTQAHWYRFERFRIGAADDTRKKDKIDPALTFGKIHPHIDSYLVTKAMYWLAGGYNEIFSGCLGGGSPFLAELSMLAEPRLLPDDIHLHVFTTSVVNDASVRTLSRDRLEYARRKAALRGKYRSARHFRFPWTKEELF